MFDMSEWVEVDDNEAKAEVLALAGMPGDLASISPADLEMHARVLDFYDMGAVASIWREGQSRLFVLTPHTAFELHGSPQPILVANNLANLKLTSENVLSYYRFFWTYVSGGQFPRLVETADFFPNPSANLRKAVRPAFLREVRDTSFVCESTMMKDGKLRTMWFAIDHNGGLDLVEYRELGEFISATFH